jgi:hypothetical protein
VEYESQRCRRAFEAARDHALAAGVIGPDDAVVPVFRYVNELASQSGQRAA